MADYPQMDFSQMHERLRLELLRRIRRGSLSVSLLARQTGFGQSHISNFLHNRRQLSLEGLDRVLFAQHIGLSDLMPVEYARTDPSEAAERGTVPVVSHAAALFEPMIRPSSVRTWLPLPYGRLADARARPASNGRRAWQRFVAVSIPPPEAMPMEPVIRPDAIVLLDRHYNSFTPYRADRPNIYAVRNGPHLAVRYLDFLLNRLVLRPHNILSPVELLEVEPGQAPADLIAGRVMLVLNEF